MAEKNSNRPNHGRTALKLCALVVGMFGFGFALVPLYDVLCDITGLGGRTGGQYTFDPAEMQRDSSRLVKVNFITNTNGGMPWKFWSESGGVRIHPGEVKQVNFYVTNPTDRRMVGQAVPSVVPPKAAELQDGVFLLRLPGPRSRRNHGDAHALHRRSESAGQRAIHLAQLRAVRHFGFCRRRGVARGTTELNGRPSAGTGRDDHRRTIGHG